MDSVTGVSTKVLDPVSIVSIVPAIEECSAEAGGLRGRCTDKGEVGTYERFMDILLSPFSLPREDATVAVDSLVGNGEVSSLHRAKTWLTICVRPPWATVWLIGSVLKRKILYTVRTAFSRDDWWTRMVGDSTRAKSALTICRETVSGVDSE